MSHHPFKSLPKKGKLEKKKPELQDLSEKTTEIISKLSENRKEKGKVQRTSCKSMDNL